MPVDTIPWNQRDFFERVRKWFFDFAWHQVLDLVEFMALSDPGPTYGDGSKLPDQFKLAAWRFIGRRLEPVTDDAEIGEVLSASQSPVREVRVHIEKALDLLGRRESPDPANAIKEAMSAVESMARVIVGEPDNTLGKLLAKLEKEHGEHEQFVKAWRELYWYTSDEGGIRHGLKLGQTGPALDQAKLFVIISSAFVNYLTSAYAHAIPSTT